MYFPQDMNFQYFFFSTYPGYFLQALPFALTAVIIYIVYQKKGKRQSSIGKMVLPSLFVCYMTGLLCLNPSSAISIIIFFTTGQAETNYIGSLLNMILFQIFTTILTAKISQIFSCSFLLEFFIQSFAEAVQGNKPSLPE